MTYNNQNSIAIQMAILFIFAIILWNSPKLHVNAANIEESQTEEETISTIEENTNVIPTTPNDGVAGFAFYYDVEEDGDTVKDTIDGYDNIEIKENIITTYKNLGIVNVNGENQLNIRKEPNTSSKVIARVKKDTGVDILDKTDDGWLQIQSGKVKGWASAEYIITGNDALDRSVSVSKPYAVVKTNGASLNVRNKDDKESKVLTQLDNGKKSLIKEIKSNGWIKIEYEKDKTGFVSAEYIEIKYLLNEAEFLPEPKPIQTTKKSSYKKKNESSSKNNKKESENNKEEESIIDYDSSTAESLVSYAKQFVGNPYVWGGTSLTNGADCSGFVLSVFSKYGYSLPHSSSAQSNYGYSISPNTGSLEKGDLVFYGDPVYHVAIYIGDGQIVHAANSRKGIIISSMTYMGSPSKARRILK